VIAGLAGKLNRALAARFFSDRNDPACINTTVLTISSRWRRRVAQRSL
jgi:hypothetical protein